MPNAQIRLPNRGSVTEALRVELPGCFQEETRILERVDSLKRGLCLGNAGHLIVARLNEERREARERQGAGLVGQGGPGEEGLLGEGEEGGVGLGDCEDGGRVLGWGMEMRGWKGRRGGRDCFGPG